MHARAHVQGLSVLGRLGCVHAQPEVADRLVGVEVVAAVQDLAGQLRPLLHSAGEEQFANLRQAVVRVGDRLVALHSPPELLVVEREALLADAAVDHGANQSCAYGHGLLELRSRSVEPQDIRRMGHRWDLLR